MEKVLIEKFNQINDLFFAEKFNSNILVGESFSLLKNTLTNICPHQKVLLISKKPENEKNLVAFLENADFKVVVLEINARQISVDNSLKMFNTPEDIRAVVCLDYELLDYALYYSKVKNISFIYLPNDLRLKYAFKTHLRIKNGKKYDTVELSYNRHIIIDEFKVNNLFCENAIVYDDVISYAFTLLEYRLLRYIRRKNTFEKSYTLIKNVITETFNILKSPIENRNAILLYASTVVGVANYITKGSFLSGLTLEVLDLYKVNARGLKLEIASKILKLSNAFFAKSVKVDKIPDYEVRIKATCKNYAEDFGSVLSAFLRCKKRFLENENNIYKFIKTTEQESSKLVGSFDVAQKICNTLSVNKQKNNIETNDVIKIGADFKESFNILSFLREKGVLEFI